MRAMQCQQVVDAICRGEKSQEVLDHLAWCASCRSVDQSTVVTLPSEISHTDQVADPTPPSRTAKIAVAIMLFGATGFLLAVAIGVLVTRSRHAREQVQVQQLEDAPKPVVTPVEPPKPPPADDQHVLTIDSDPLGAVSIDGAERCNTPCRLELKPGRYLVEIRAAGYHTARKTIEIAADADPLPLALRLDKAAARDSSIKVSYRDAEAAGGALLSVATSPPARVSADGRDTGRTAPILRMAIAAGSHAIDLRTPDGATAQVKITVKPNQEVRVLKEFK